jgi:hypothetical protein
MNNTKLPQLVITVSITTDKAASEMTLNVRWKSERMILSPAESICFDGIWNANLMHQNQDNYVEK